MSTQMMAELHYPGIAVGANWPEAAPIRDLHYAPGSFIGNSGGAQLILSQWRKSRFQSFNLFGAARDGGIVIQHLSHNGHPRSA